MSKSNKCYLNNSNVGNKYVGYMPLSLPLPYAGEGTKTTQGSTP